MSDNNVSMVGSEQNLVTVTTRKSLLKRRTKAERRLLVVIAVLLVLCIAFLVAIVMLAYVNQQQHPAMLKAPTTCSSSQCIASASALMQSIDTTADPCEDFYQFACGNWDKEHPVREDQFSSTWFSERSDFLLRQIKEQLSGNKTEVEPRAVQQAKLLYSDCMDTEKLEEVGMQPVLEVLGNVSLPREIPSFRTVVGWDIATTLAQLQRVLSFDSLVQLAPDVEGNKIIFNLSACYPESCQDSPGALESCRVRMGAGLSPATGASVLVGSLVSDPDDFPEATKLSGREALRAKLTYMMGVIAEVESWDRSPDEYRANASDIASAAIKILLFSASVTQAISEGTNSTAVKTTFDALQRIMDLSIRGAKYSHRIDWGRYLSTLVQGVGPVDVDVITVTDVNYFQNLAWIIANEKLETVQRYIWWQVVDLLVPHTNQAMSKLRQELLERFLGHTPLPSRSTVCMKRVKKLLPMAVSYTMAMQDDFTHTVSKVMEMLEDIRESFNHLVQQGDWIDEKTKQAAKEKAEAITSFVGYQKWLLQPGQLDLHYRNLNLTEGHYLWNILSIKAGDVKDFLMTMSNHSFDVNQKTASWNSTDPLQVNAYYSRTENAIIIPAGILQFPFYGRGLESLNYGSIGTILGHELTHGFDIEGKDYNKDGTKGSWWDSDTLRAYEKRAQCFVQQYSNFSLSDRHKVDGLSTLAENIADNGGLREAYWAYQRYKERHGLEPALPGFEAFTHDQLLFLAFANLWCVDPGTEYDEVAMKDSHSPARFRVIGSVSNSPEFSKTWHCSSSSSMNPSSRCIIW